MAHVITDVSVPISHYPALVARAQQARQSFTTIDTYIVGHAGDGNMHTFLFFEESPDQRVLVQGFSDQIVEHALALGGTCTGEHGIGIGKRKYLQQEHGMKAVETMRQIKHQLDPVGILNPGKVLP
jgi:D-lactate dehydrogenase (cytochrome)